MKIGILTFHSQLNYGGVLQCWALQTVLEKMGHEAVVIDRWLTPDNWYLERGYDRKGKKWWLRFWLRSLLGLGDMRFWLRVRRTKKFIREKLHLTPYHFCDWKDAPRDLGVDMIVVGSDQVWRCATTDPRPYLLNEAPNVPAIAYAASFGLPRLPVHLFEALPHAPVVDSISVYKEGLSRFGAISCREMEGVGICESLGFQACHVLDPTQLLTREDWQMMAFPSKNEKYSSESGNLVCYFLKEDVDSAIPLLLHFARKANCGVRVFVYDRQRVNDFIPAPTSLSKSFKWIRGLLSRRGPVTICESCGPMEFLRVHATARWILTDSFHSLMFAIIFGKDVRVLAPQNDNRRVMFARMEEIAAHMSHKIICQNVSEALNSFLANEHKPDMDFSWLKQKRASSVEFLGRGLTGNFV